MDKRSEKREKTLRLKEQPETVSLYPGISLAYLESPADGFFPHQKNQKHVLLIHYCRMGCMSWQTENGNEIYLGSGDFLVHTMEFCQNSMQKFPTGIFNGLVITIDLQETAKNPPELLKNTDAFPELFRARFCSRNNTFTFFAGGQETEAIFSLFYDQPEAVRLAYQKIKTTELLLYLWKTEPNSCGCKLKYHLEQEDLIREIHDYLLEHIDQRITIQDLSRKYLINPTSLKNTFKDVYGISLASHMKEHRMDYAAEMLRETCLSISEIAQRVGYDSQSRFADAFKAHYQILPTEYRRQRCSCSHIPCQRPF